MKTCKVCGAEMRDDEKVCKYCRSAANEEDVDMRQSESQQEVCDTDEEYPSLKYKDFLDDDALYKFGMCKLSGIGMEKNENEAFQIFQALSYRGHLDAMFKLAEMYERMSPPKLEAAVVWLKVAADRGHEPSKIKLRSVIDFVGPELYENKPIEIPRDVGGFENLVRQALPHVVLIRVVGKNRKREIVRCGAGFIVQSGYVITNAHVVGEKAECIYANFEPGYDNKEYVLHLVALFPEYDIAVLTFSGLFEKKISTSDHLHLRSGNVEYGEEVYTIGNPLGIGFSVSKGVVSCPDRRAHYPKAVDTVIQVDITANHGNSGGALLDQYNNVLGILTFIPEESGGGITMCVPTKYIVEALNRL